MELHLMQFIQQHWVNINKKVKILIRENTSRWISRRHLETNKLLQESGRDILGLSSCQKPSWWFAAVNAHLGRRTGRKRCSASGAEKEALMVYRFVMEKFSLWELLAVQAPHSEAILTLLFKPRVSEKFGAATGPTAHWKTTCSYQSCAVPLLSGTWHLNVGSHKANSSKLSFFWELCPAWLHLSGAAFACTITRPTGREHVPGTRQLPFSSNLHKYFQGRQTAATWNALSSR